MPCITPSCASRSVTGGTSTKKAFRELYALGDSGQEGLETPYDKFLFFLSYVSKAAGEDVVAATYTPGELALIEESLRN